MTTTQYIGPRIIPVFAPEVEWDIDSTYDHLTMVQHQGETYMTRQYVPAGIQLPDATQDEEYNDYWVHMSNWNAQVESYRQEVLAYNGRISTLENDLPLADYDSVNTVSAAIADLAAYLPTTDFDKDTNTVSAIITKEINNRKNQDALRAIQFDTVTDMKNSNDLTAGTIAHTNGYYAKGDGGSAYYHITDTGTANEINVIACGDLYATFIPGNGFITPKEMGCKGDGLSVDNDRLNKLFEIAGNHNLKVIGNKDETYLIDDSTATIDSHYGVLIPKPISIENCNFKLAPSVQALTCILTCKYGVNDYFIENCSFETDVYPYNLPVTQEDCGNHALFFIDDETFPSDWQTGFGDIHIIDCDFNQVWSYSIFPTPFDGLLEVKNCNFNDVYGIGVLTYCTNSVIENCKYNVIEYAGHVMVESLCHDEIENFSSVTAIKKNVSINNCISNKSVFRVHEYPQQGIVYGDIVLRNCKNTSNYLALAFELTSVSNINVGDKLVIDGCEFYNIQTSGFKNAIVDIINTEIAVVFAVGSNKEINITNCVSQGLYITNNIEIINVSNTVFKDIGNLGCFNAYNSSVHVNNININNVTMATGGKALVRNLWFDFLNINGLRNTDTTQGIQIVNNYQYNTDKTMMVIGSGIYSPAAPVGNQTFIDVNTVVVTGIGPAGAMTSNAGVSHSKIELTWY